MTIISYGHEINNEEFENYTKETAELCVELFNWYRMPPSIPTILVDGLIIIKTHLFLLGSYQRKPMRQVIKTVFDLESIIEGKFIISSSVITTFCNNNNDYENNKELCSTGLYKIITNILLK